MECRDVRSYKILAQIRPGLGDTVDESTVSYDVVRRWCREFKLFRRSQFQKMLKKR